MAKYHCLAMAYGSEPVRCLVVGVRRNLVYVARPSGPDSDQPQGIGAVGYPQQFVSEYEKPLYYKLLTEYQAGDVSRLGELWGQARKIPKESLDTLHIRTKSVNT